MTRSYFGELSLEASVPEHSELASYFKGFVQFPIFCPTCGLEKGDIKKNGFDKGHTARPQWFYCKQCHHSFYAHTSGVYQVLAQLEWQKIIASLFEDRLRPKAVGKRHDVSASWLSQMLHHQQDAVELRLAQLAQEHQTLTEQTTLPVPLEDAIWWDEMFFRVGKTSWGLLLLVNAQGKPLAWKVSRTRTKEDYLELLAQLGQRLPVVPIFIGDGGQAYQKVCKELGQECFLIEHLHSQPWEHARVHHFKLDEPSKHIVQISLEVPFNTFIRNWPVIGKTFKRRHPSPDPNCPKNTPGRPKGSKNKKKRRTKNTSGKQEAPPAKQKRGAKSLTTDGRRVQFHPTPLEGSTVKWYISSIT